MPPNRSRPPEVEVEFEETENGFESLDFRNRNPHPGSRLLRFANRISGILGLNFRILNHGFQNPDFGCQKSKVWISTPGTQGLKDYLLKGYLCVHRNSKGVPRAVQIHAA